MLNKYEMKSISLRKAISLLKEGKEFYFLYSNGEKIKSGEATPVVLLYIHSLKGGLFGVKEKRSMFKRNFDFKKSFHLGKKRVFNINMSHQKGGVFSWSTAYCKENQ